MAGPSCRWRSPRPPSTRRHAPGMRHLDCERSRAGLPGRPRRPPSRKCSTGCAGIASRRRAASKSATRRCSGKCRNAGWPAESPTKRGGDVSATTSLRDGITAGTARVGVLGLGYVGLTEALELARAGFPVTGFDIDGQRVRAVLDARSYLVDVSDADLAAVLRAGTLTATDDFQRLGEQDVLLICVPTPLGKSKAPDLSYIISAVEAIRPRLRRGQLVVLESTTYPGTTREVVLPALESTGLRAGTDFHLCFSPERIHPGATGQLRATMPRVVGGTSPAGAEPAGPR